jgi:alkylation response protein AidB-like acyl-CoA dehydrogenase
MGIPFPEEYGGAGADSLAYAIAVEELTRVDSSVAITMCAHTSLGTQPIYLFGNEEQKRDWLPELTAGRRLGAFGLTSRRPGRTPATCARGRARRRRVGHQRREAVHHQRRHRHLGHGLHHRPHRRRRDLQHPRRRTARPATSRASRTEDGLERVDTRPLAFTDCRVPEENLLGPRGAGFKQFLRCSTSGASVSRRWASDSPRARSTRRSRTAKERKAFGKPISKYQAIQAKLADMATEIEAARLLDLQGGAAEGRRAQLHADRGAGEAQDGPSRRALRRGGRPDPRRVRLHRGVPGVPLLPATRRSSRSARAPTRFSRW